MVNTEEVELNNKNGKEAKMIRIRRAIADAKAGRLTEHELIEVGDE